MCKLNKILLRDKLTEAFINYQYRLDNPMPLSTDTPEAINIKFHSDPLFNNKVNRLVAGVISIVSDVENNQKAKE